MLPTQFPPDLNPVFRIQELTTQSQMPRPQQTSVSLYKDLLSAGI